MLSARRNPFFIRSVFVPLPLLRTQGVCGRVAIPFSSGLCSFPRPRRNPSSPEGRNPFFIRSVFVPLVLLKILSSADESQSLFHQVCVRSRPDRPRSSWIPSRNPFFIRSVFVPSGARQGRAGRVVAIPFSSGLCSFSRDRHYVRQPAGVAIPFSSGLCSFKKRSRKKE